MYKIMRSFGTAYPGVVNMVSKDAGDSKEKRHETSWCELLALQTYCAKVEGGGSQAPPPGLVRVKTLIYIKIM